MQSFLRLFSPGRIILVGSLVVVGYLLFSAGGSFLKSYRIADDEARLQGQVDQLHGQEQQLQQIRDYLRSDEYVQYMARRVFGLVMPGESLVVVQAPEQQPTPTTDAGPRPPWWQTLFGR